MAETDLITYTRVLNRWKKFILGVVGGVAVLSVIVSFLVPKWYKAHSTLIAPQESSLESGLASQLSHLSIPGLGSMAPAGSESDLFLAILDSRILREKLVQDFDLMEVYKAKTMDDAVRANRRLATAAITDRGVVEVNVEDRDPKRAADMANEWVSLLDDFNKTARMTSGRKTRIFVEKRLDETRAALAAAEDTLADYQLTHKSAPLTADVSAAVDAAANLQAQRMALQVRYNMLSDLYRDDAPQMSQVRAELAALDRQTDLLPPMAVDYARLVRNLKVQEEVFTLLTAQYEEAKIRENKDIPTVEVLDPAVPPQRRSRPVRWLFCASLTFAAVILTVGAAFTVEFVRRIRAGAEA
jgi:uncharacterized protein involved in exopolysaccharide biosynthesis